MPWRRRDALPEAEIVLLFRFPGTILRRKKSSLNSRIDSDSILLTREQSLSRGGINPDLPFTAPIRRNKKLQKWLKNVDHSSLVTNREKGMKAHFAVEHRDPRTGALIKRADYQRLVNAHRSVHHEMMNNK
jgi:hypothetical protein